MIISSKDAQKLLNGICWYLECAMFASMAIDAFRPAADPFQMRMHYSLYVTNLFSAIDMAVEVYGKIAISNALDRHLAGTAFPSGDLTGYLRELRNAVVHRGVDPTEGGLVIDGRVCARAPATVTNQSGKISYAAPHPLLRDIFILFDGPAKLALRDVVEPAIEQSMNVNPEELLASTLGVVRSVPHMPGWAKDLAHQHLSREMVVAAHESSVQKLLRLFAPWQDVSAEKKSEPC